MRRLLLFCLLLAPVLLVSCDRNKEEVIVFDSTYPLALAPDVEWALVTDPYASYREEGSWSSFVTGHCRRGEILQVLAKSSDSERLEWFRFEGGWLPSSCISVYSNRLKAQSVAATLTD